VGTLRSALGDSAFTHSWNAGQITSIDQAAVEAAELVAALATTER
jgi:hypothetical protein